MTSAGAIRAKRPVREIAPGRGRVSREALAELWEYREVLLALLQRFVKVKYKQAVVGIGWSVLQPAVTAAVLAIVVGRVANVASEGQPYFLFALAGTVAWTYFSTAVGTAMEILVEDRQVLQKVYFPREVAPLSAIGAALVDLVPALAVLFVAAAIAGIWPALSWIALPIPLVLLVLTAAALGLGFSALNVYYRDVRYALPFALQLGVFITPVFYSAQSIDQPWRSIYEIVNPVAAAMENLRAIVLGGDWPAWGVTGAAMGWSLLLLLGAYAFFKSLEHGFSDRV